MKQNKDSNMKFVVILTLLAVAILAAVVVFSNKEETSTNGYKENRCHWTTFTWGSRCSCNDS